MSSRVFMNKKWNIKVLGSVDICSPKKIWGVKNATNEQMIKKMVFLHQVKTRYNKTLEMPESTLTRKEPQFPFRLLNILILDPFAEGFLSAWECNSPLRTRFRKAANYQLFWEGAQELQAKIQQSTSCILRWWSPAGSTLRQFQKNSASRLEEALFSAEADKWWLQGSSQSFHKMLGTHSSNIFVLWGLYWKLSSTMTFRNKPDLSGTVVADLLAEVLRRWRCFSSRKSAGLLNSSTDNMSLSSSIKKRLTRHESMPSMSGRDCSSISES